MISIIITAYNVENYIKEAIDSVLAQTHTDLECIVVLDQPTDHTPDIVKQFKDPRLKIIENEKNLGAGLSRRAGTTAAKGDYILLLDGDDYLAPDFIETLYQRALETDADIISGGMTMINPDGSYEIHSNGNTLTQGHDNVVKFWGQKIVFMNNKLLRSQLFQKVPYSHRRYIEDTPVIIPMLWHANKVAYTDHNGYYYRNRPDSLSHTADWFKEWLFKGLCYCDLIEFFNANDPDLYRHLDIRHYALTIFNILNSRRLTIEEVNRYPAEWAELWFRLTNIIKFESINFK